MQQRAFARLFVVAFPCLGTAACSSPYQAIEGISASHSADGNGRILEAVAAIPKAALLALHDSESNGEGFADFAQEARDDTVFDHVGIDYNAHGHGPPGVNDIPHIDAHFYMISTSDREAISCGDQATPVAAEVPTGVVVNVDAEPFGGCVPTMGGHGGLPYDKLTANMIYGYHDSHLIFVEPMVDVQKIIDEVGIELAILAPTALAVPGRYPSRFFARYTETAVEFVVTDFVDIK